MGSVLLGAVAEGGDRSQQSSSVIGWSQLCHEVLGQNMRCGPLGSHGRV